MITLPDKTSVGGVGCKHCVHWHKLETGGIKETLALFGEWGSCTSPKFQTDASATLHREKTAREKEKIYLHEFYGDVIPYTLHSYCCGHIRTKLE